MRRHLHPINTLDFNRRCACGETTFRQYLALWGQAGSPHLEYDDLERPLPHCDPPIASEEGTVIRRPRSFFEAADDEPPHIYGAGGIFASSFSVPRDEPEPFHAEGGTFGGGGASESWESSSSDAPADSPATDDSVSSSDPT